MSNFHQFTTPSTPAKCLSEIKTYSSPDPCDCLYKHEGESTKKYDFYSIELQNFIFSVVNKKRSPFIQQEPDPKIRELLIKKTKRLRNVYTVERCKQNQFHVVIISTKKPVPMLNRTLEMLRDCHEDHEDSYKLLKRMSELYDYYCLNFVKKYIYQFVVKCPSCAKNVEKTPFWDSHNLDILQDIKQAQLNIMNPYEEHNDDFGDIFYDEKNCPYNCKDDHYDEYYAFLCRLYLEGRKKLDEFSLNELEKKKIKKELSECKMMKCNRNTEHLWRLDYKYRNEPKWKYDNLKMQAYKRVPMEQEKLFLAKILHGKNHRNPQKMLLGMARLPFLFKTMKDYILHSYDYCQSCCRFIKARQLETKGNKKQNTSTESCEYEDQRIENQKPIRIKISGEDKLLQTIKKETKNETDNAAYESLKKQKLIQKIRLKQNQIDEKNVLIKIHAVQNGSPNVIVISSLSLQKSYHTYGDCLYFETFTHFLGIKQCWQTYFFSGIDEGKNQMVFAACLIDKPSFEGFFYAFTLFFEMMYNQYPQSICTPYDHQISQALDSLISYSQDETLRRVAHCYFWNSSISHFAEMIKKQNKAPGTISKIIEIMKTPSPRKCTETLELLEKFLQSDSEALMNIKQQKEKLCWTKLPPSFIGLCLDYTRTQNLLHFLQKNITVRKSPVQFINNISILKNPVYKLSNSWSPSLYSARQLEDLRPDLHPKIMQLLTSRCINSYKIKEMEWKSPTVIVVEEELGTFTLSYSLIFDHWECSCRDLERTGVPCPHLIRVIKQMGGEIRYYVNQRWLLDKEY